MFRILLLSLLATALGLGNDDVELAQRIKARRERHLASAELSANATAPFAAAPGSLGAVYVLRTRSTSPVDSRVSLPHAAAHIQRSKKSVSTPTTRPHTGH